jgi:TrmH family RNA methyltransferase
MNAEITSVQNERVKRIIRLQRKASARREEGLTVIEGSREVSRAIENGWQPVELWFCPELGDSQPLMNANGHEWTACSKAVFEKISYREGPDGVLAVGPLVGKSLADLKLSANPLILVAEGLEKPGNLGALLRTADGAGADAVIVCDPVTDLNNPNVIRASIGTLFYLPVAEATSEETIAFLKAKGVKILSAVPDAEAVYTGVDMTGPVAIVVGAEDKGLSSRWTRAQRERPRDCGAVTEGNGKNVADLNVKIPMLGKNDSLNVSVSAAILLYEAVRQRK